MSDFISKVESLSRDLPDAAEAERFLTRFVAEHATARRRLERDTGLLADLLALAAWSPFLASTLLQHPEYLQWLARVRTEARVRTAEELGESLARFAATNTALPPAALLARFRRRELLRIYLRDIRSSATLVETTEELSNLADAALAYALGLARQELDNLYGAPLRTDARGRAATAGFCVVALGKLGSRELNYASDIDLLFLYSDDGSTSGTGTRGATTNREYFVRLATRVSSIVGGTGVSGGEGSAYRVDLRLRPHGRDGVLAPSIAEAARYYREKAQPWERQVLIRSRAAAGSPSLFTRFNEETCDAVFRQGETIAGALEHVRKGKSKIDQQHNSSAKEERAFNVKLGRGGIREIEFIAQALQLAYGGLDEWLRAAHTLVSLGRIRDRKLIHAAEHTILSDAYAFLRAVEHRVQMEHGLQTHGVPSDAAARTKLARRMNFTGDDALADFDRTLEARRAGVRRVFDRVFGSAAEEDATREEGVPNEDDPTKEASDNPKTITPATPTSTPPANKFADSSAFVLGVERGGAHHATRLELSRHFVVEGKDDRLRAADEILAASLSGALNERRAHTYLARVAASLAKAETIIAFDAHQLGELVRLCGASEFFGEMIANNPRLIAALPTRDEAGEDTEKFAGRCAERFAFATDASLSFVEALARLRGAWADLIVCVGAEDAGARVDFREANRRQTTLAVASLDAACAVAARELSVRHNDGAPLVTPPRVAVLGLGRLGGGGMDYGSDLDLVLVFDDETPSPLPGHTHEAAYSLFAETIAAALSSLTRDGYLYRVDLRLRPDGNNGALVNSRTSFINYLRDRAAAWELLAYVKLHPSAGDRVFGARVLEDAHAAMRDAAARLGADAIRVETRRVRERLERERAGRRSTSDRIDIKFGAGGMLDVYFAARFLQLRDQVREDTADDRTTTATLDRLHESGSLAAEDWRALRDGYALLRPLDHFMRLILGRGTRLPPADSPALADLAKCLRYDSPIALHEDLRARMNRIREAFDRITT